VPANVQGGLFGAGGVTLDVLQPSPTIDLATGTFSGPAVPASVAFNVKPAEVFVPAALVENYTAQVRIDSIVPGFYTVEYFFTVTQGDDVQQVSTGELDMAVGDEMVADPIVLASYQINLPADSSAARAAGLGPITVGGSGAIEITLWPAAWQSNITDLAHEVAGLFWSNPDAIALEGGSRWFAGDNETTADPTVDWGHGALPDVTTIYEFNPYVDADALGRRFYQVAWAVHRAADIKVYWGATPGAVDSVIDVTHMLPVLFDPQNRASYGFRGDITGTTAGSAADGVLTYWDFVFGACLPGASGIDNTGCGDRDYTQAATLAQVDVDGDLAADGSGFGLYINGHPFIFQTNALPSATVWTLRSYAGEVVRDAEGQYSFRSASTNSGQKITANAAVPGLTGGYFVASRAAYPDTVSAESLEQVHTVPDPYYATSSMEVTPSAKVLKFVNLPTKAIIRIYSVSGVLLRVIEHDDPTGGGEATWDLRNRNNQYVASGVYFFHVETPDGKEKIGRFTVVNYTP
jgi:hypothetical protein